MENIFQLQGQEQVLSYQFHDGVKLETVLAVRYLTGADGEISRTMNRVRQL